MSSPQRSVIVFVALLATLVAASDLYATGDQHHHHASHHHQQQQPVAVAHHRRRLQRRDSGTRAAAASMSVREQCDAVKGYFENIDIKLSGDYDEKGSICNGNCCRNSTEVELRKKATNDFERLLHHHTESLRAILESTANQFEEHVLVLAEHSENRTLNVFSQVYRRMVPQSKKLINQLYNEIMGYLKNPNGKQQHGGNFIAPGGASSGGNLYSLDLTIEQFFVQLFPVAYHQAVHLNNDNNGELHEDYISCLQHTFDDLQPFAEIPKEIKRQLLQAVQTAQIFMSSLLQSAEVLSATDELYATYLTDTCKRQLLKMSYCPGCTGIQKTHAKVCYSYCINVLRGCSAQFAGVLDSPWSSVVDAIDNLVQSYILSTSGIMNVLQQLDSKLSEAIMKAMATGPELEVKVKKTCGTPKLLPSKTGEEPRPPQSAHPNKWPTPSDAKILHFLSKLDKSKEFYSNIVNNVCEDEDVQRNDHHCWTGDRIGDYTQLLMTSGTDTQRYNPEVPLESNEQSSELNELVDKLIKIRKNIGSAIPSITRSYSDIQSDMARHDEEGSGRMPDDADDEEYGNIHGSGDGSGDGATSSPFDPSGPTVTTEDGAFPRANDGASASAGAGLSWQAFIVTLVILASCSYRYNNNNNNILAIH